jgi:hypothetical protein
MAPITAFKKTQCILFTDLLKGAGALPATSPTGRDPSSEDDRSRPGLQHRYISGLGREIALASQTGHTAAHTMKQD